MPDIKVLLLFGGSADELTPDKSVSLPVKQVKLLPMELISCSSPILSDSDPVSSSQLKVSPST